MDGVNEHRLGQRKPSKDIESAHLDPFRDKEGEGTNEEVHV